MAEPTSKTSNEDKSLLFGEVNNLVKISKLNNGTVDISSSVAVDDGNGNDVGVKGLQKGLANKFLGARDPASQKALENLNTAVARLNANAPKLNKYSDLIHIAKGDDPNKKKYYQHNKDTQLNKMLEGGKRFPNYGGPPEDAFDKYNALGVQSKEPTKDVKDDWSDKSDLIPFYFNDLVNSKWIPFRATLKGLSDTNTAEWEETRYLGRPDQIYTYKGFTRELSFDFTVFAGSVKELLPMWQRINYLVGLTRPSQWVQGTKISNSATDNTYSFMVAPFVKFRIGDLFRNQPAILKTVTVTIPEDAEWETEIVDNAVYEYYNGLVQVSGVSSAQVPRRVDVSVSLTLLQKDRVDVRVNHYGDDKESPFANALKTVEDNPVLLAQDNTNEANNTSPVMIG